MKTRLHKFLLMLCLFLLSASIIPVAYGQRTNISRFDIQIEGGQLSLAPVKGRVDVKEFQLYGPIDSAEATLIVPATIANLAKFLRAADTNVNITVAPSAADIQIKDMKLRGADVEEVVEAVGTATDGAVRVGGNGAMKPDFFFHASQQQKPARTIEVFNLSGYFWSQGVAPVDIPSKTNLVNARLGEIEKAIVEAIDELHAGDSELPDHPQFNFHPGTSLLVVIGSPETIEVTRKFINALPGQPHGNQVDLLDMPAAPKEK